MRLECCRFKKSRGNSKILKCLISQNNKMKIFLYNSKSDYELQDEELILEEALIEFYELSDPAAPVYPPRLCGTASRMEFS